MDKESKELVPNLNQIPKLDGALAILGMGVSGLSTLQLLLKIGCKNIVGFDQKLSREQFDENLEKVGLSKINLINSTETLLELKPRVAVVSPGFSLSAPWLKALAQAGTLLTSELELAYQVLTTEKVIGITGSIGKSTTTTLLGLALNAESSCFYGGNLGEPLARYAYEVLSGKPKAKFVTLELSSYQLEMFRNLQCEISIFSYLTPNHLDRYTSLDEYYKTKWELAKRTRKRVICNPLGGDLKSFVEQQNFLLAPVSWPKPEDFLNFNFNRVKMLGSYQWQNISLVLAACQELETSDKIFKVLEDFPGLPHRMENLGLKDGVLYINDSKATTIPSVIEACHTAREKLSPGATLHLLLGGRDKNLNWEALKALRTFEAKTKFYFFGEAREKIRTASGLRGLQFNKMFDAVQAAKQAAKCSDIVLLSPGGTSHDEFLSFEDRGKQFKNLIANF